MITNAKDRSVSPSLFGMGSALFGLTQPISCFRVTKVVVNFEVVETLTRSDLQGVIQPLKPQSLSMKPQGQRSWKWFTLHDFSGVNLSTDDVVYISSLRYRIMEKLDYSAYGYVEYHMVQDYQDSSTVPV